MRKATATALAAAVIGLGAGLPCTLPALAGAAEAVDGTLSLQVDSQPGGAMTGIIRNSGPRVVGEVRLLVRHTWLWNNERHPGAVADNPGRSAYFVVDGEVPAYGDIRFRYTPSPPLPSRTDGSFSTTADIVSFVEGAPQNKP